MVSKENLMYIDPNSGGMLFQALLVAFGVISGTILLFSSKIKMGIAKLRRRFRERTEDVEDVVDEVE
jgi:uncharacterized YccA/Bax inhibitor family protein